MKRPLHFVKGTKNPQKTIPKRQFRFLFSPFPVYSNWQHCITLTSSAQLRLHCWPNKSEKEKDFVEEAVLLILLRTGASKWKGMPCIAGVWRGDNLERLNRLFRLGRLFRLRWERVVLGFQISCRVVFVAKKIGGFLVRGNGNDM